MVLSGWKHPVSTETYYLGSMIQATHYDYREPLPVYASHAQRIADELLFTSNALEDSPQVRRQGRRLMATLALSLLVGYFVSFTSTLWTEYKYAWTQDVSAHLPINEWGARDNPEQQILAPTIQYERGRYFVAHSTLKHWLAGFGITAVLGFLRLHFTWWPLHPIGYLMIGTYPGAHLWFSIMIGWLAKVAIVRFGGAKLYVAAKPFFLGLIVGESAAAGFWLLCGIILSLMHVPYRPVNIMPG